MRKFRLSSAVAALALSGGAAMPADLAAPLAAAVPPAPLAPGATFNWTGFYGGVDGGYIFGKTSNQFSLLSPPLATFVPDAIAQVEAAGSQTANFRGGIFGVEVGYDSQIGDSFVVGASASAEYRHFDDSVHFAGNLPADAGGFPETLDQTLKSDWAGAAKLRVGFIPMDRMLVYVTGGLGVARMQYSSVFKDSVNENESASVTAFSPGGVVGAGIEYAFAQNWSVKAEYDYARYAAVKATGQAILTNGTIATVAHSSGTLDTNTFRIGLNYLFR